MVPQDDQRKHTSRTSKSNPLRFWKLQGAGNDFVLLDGLQQPLPEANLAVLAQRLCDRRYGVGADGMLIMLPTQVADYRMRILNADGSEARMCGNGIRCFARYLFEYHCPQASAICIETGAGIRQVHRISENRFTVEMGQPTIVPDPEFTVVDMGALHVVLFVEDVGSFPLEVQGQAVENHPRFPDRVNVSVAQVDSPDRAQARVWERGAGATLACGTGACAITVAGAMQGLLQRTATIQMPGGDLQVEWRADDTLWLTGDAELVFEGVFHTSLIKN
ncbi:MAG: diaminopimelate epimerase [Fimbriimonadales bacterium]|nr:MAG: diaminopimelate epimerase [Fimbriimonadales bacterium]